MEKNLEIKHPRITVITPSYNQGIYLEECILSVLNQNYPNLEFIVIDGGSTDKSIEIIKKYSNKINYWVSEEDRGQSHAINKGLEKSTGEIISWLCSDDMYLPGTLLKVAKEFTDHPEIGLLHGKTILFGNGRKDLIKGADPEDLALRYFSIIPFPQPSSFFSRKVITEQGNLEESFHFGMDYDLLIRIALHYPIKSVEDIYSRYRLHAESKTIRILPSFAKDWADVFLKFLRSVEGGNKYIQELNAIGICNSDQSKYSHEKNFDPNELKIIFCHFLLNQLIIYYEVFDKKEVKKFLKLINKVDQKFYRKYLLNKINFRLKFVPIWILNKIRMLKR